MDTRPPPTASPTPSHRATWAAPWPPWPPTRARPAGTSSRSPPPSWPRSTDSPISTVPSPTPGPGTEPPPGAPGVPTRPAPRTRQAGYRGARRGILGEDLVHADLVPLPVLPARVAVGRPHGPTEEVACVAMPGPATRGAQVPLRAGILGAGMIATVEPGYLPGLRRLRGRVEVT